METTRTSHHGDYTLVDEKGLDVRPDSPVTHRLIIGDNLPIMRMIEPEYKGMVDVIYIDPPYNTGGSFIYRDNYNGIESGWIGFMRPRLQEAKAMLAPTGVIFVSIDEHERYELKPLMDSVFGASCFIADITWRKKTTSGSSSARPTINTMTESILVYGGSASVALRGRPITRAYKYGCRDEYYDERGGYYERRMDSSSLRYSPTLDFPIEFNGRTYYAGDTVDGVAPTREDMERRIREHHERDWCWTWSREHVEWGIRNGLVTMYNGQVARKIYLKVDNWCRPINRTYNYPDIIDDKDIISMAGTRDQIHIFGKRVFSYPKPVSLLKYLIMMSPKDDALIMDFFAGSGTTAHAAAELNLADGGHRRCILITDDDGDGKNRLDIGREVTAERLRRVLTGTDWADGKPHPDTGEGLHVQSLSGPNPSDADAAGDADGNGDA